MATTFTFYNAALETDLHLTVEDDKALENLQALITLGFDPKVSVK